MAMIEVLAFLVGLLVIIYVAVMGAWYFGRRDKGNRVGTTAPSAVNAGKIDSY